MLRYSNKSAKKIGHKARLHQSKRTQIRDDIDLMVSSCPNLRKVNLVVHYKTSVIESEHSLVWDPLLRLHNLSELDLVTMKFENIKSLLTIVGPRLERLTVECDEEQGNGSEIVHIARHCPDISSLRILLGDKVLRGEMTLHFGQTFFRKLEKLTVEGSVHLHGFAFLWGHCQNLKYIRIGELTDYRLRLSTCPLSRLGCVQRTDHHKCSHPGRLHSSLPGEAVSLLSLLCYKLFLGQQDAPLGGNAHQKSEGQESCHGHSPSRQSPEPEEGIQLVRSRTSLFPILTSITRFLDLYGEDMATFKRHLKKYKARGLQIDYKEW